MKLVTLMQAIICGLCCGYVGARCLADFGYPNLDLLPLLGLPVVMIICSLLGERRANKEYDRLRKKEAHHE
jgi:hypothetical protein